MKISSMSSRQVKNALINLEPTQTITVDIYGVGYSGVSTSSYHLSSIEATSVFDFKRQLLGEARGTDIDFSSIEFDNEGIGDILDSYNLSFEFEIKTKMTLDEFASIMVDGNSYELRMNKNGYIYIVDFAIQTDTKELCEAVKIIRDTNLELLKEQS